MKYYSTTIPNLKTVSTHQKETLFHVKVDFLVFVAICQNFDERLPLNLRVALDTITILTVLSLAVYDTSVT